MSRRDIQRLLLAAFVLAWAGSVRAQSFAWWKSEQFQQEVGLTSEQCDRIDKVFHSTLPKLREGKQELDEREAELSRLIESNADEADVIKQVDQVEAVRASLNKMRTLLLLHERQVLTPEQLVKFKSSYEKWTTEHRRHRSDEDAPRKK